MQDYGNPLRLRRAPRPRRARDRGALRLALATASDLDRGPDGPAVSNFTLFTRLMEEAH